MVSERMSVAELSQAAEVYSALHSQIEMTKAHVERLREKRDRYVTGSPAWGHACLDVTYWEDHLTIMQAVYRGVTVPPS